ncbi:MAG: amidohydrolase family protein, partial [Acidobacteriota bacterium]
MRQRLIVPVIVLAVLGMAAPATADETVADDAVTYVRAGRFVDVDAGEVLADRVLVLRGERVARVEPAAEIEIPRGAQVVDLTGHTVLPGLIDMHVHMTGDHRFHGYRSLGIS